MTNKSGSRLLKLASTRSYAEEEENLVSLAAISYYPRLEKVPFT